MTSRPVRVDACDVAVSYRFANRDFPGTAIRMGLEHWITSVMPWREMEIMSS